MTVLQGVDHGGADVEQTVVRHLIIHFRTIDLVDGIPIDALNVEEGILRVHFVPKVLEHVDWIVGRVLVGNDALTRGKNQCQKAE